jgi:hypothetical protein
LIERALAAGALPAGHLGFGRVRWRGHQSAGVDLCYTATIVHIHTDEGRRRPTCQYSLKRIATFEFTRSDTSADSAIAIGSVTPAAVATGSVLAPDSATAAVGWARCIRSPTVRFNRDDGIGRVPRALAAFFWTARALRAARVYRRQN